MPGNETVERSNKSYAPFIWKEVNMTSNQSATAVSVSGFPSGIKRFAPPRNASVVSLNVQLSSALTAGNAVFELTKGGTATGYSVTMNAAAGTSKKLYIAPGDLTGGPGDRIAIEWSSSAAMAPSGSIDAVIYIEIQDA